MSESTHTAGSPRWAVALLIAAVGLGTFSFIAGRGLADAIWHAQQGAGLVGAVLFGPLAYVVEAYAYTMTLLFAFGFLLQCRQLVTEVADVDGKELRPTDLLGLGLLGMQVAFGLGLLVCVASALALMLASPVLDPVRFLSVAAAIVLALAGPLTWAAGRMNPPATWLRALAWAGRSLALAPSKTVLGRSLGAAPNDLRMMLGGVFLSALLLAGTAVAMRWSPFTWAWMPELNSGEPGQLIPDHYADQRKAMVRPSPVPYISSFEVEGGFLTIFYPYDPVYHPYAMARRCPDLPAQALDSPSRDERVAWRARLLTCVADVHVLKLNGSVIGGSEWRVGRDPASGLRGFSAALPISGLAEGMHLLQIERPKLQEGVVVEPDTAPYEIAFWRTARP